MAQKQTTHTEGEHEDERVEVDSSAAVQEQHDKLDQVGKEADRLCDDIDAALCEVNAADFVRGYVQKGGQ